MDKDSRVKILKEALNLQEHSEGGFFSEVYTANFEQNGRPLAGSIYFLLDGKEISHFHKIDCDEIWYYHEGCGLKIIIIDENQCVKEYFLGKKLQDGENFMILIPKGNMFAAENLDKTSFTLVSCVTVPKFKYDAFYLACKDEIKYPDLKYLAYNINEIN